jgi:hypothetical protein
LHRRLEDRREDHRARARGTRRRDAVDRQHERLLETNPHLTDDQSIRQRRQLGAQDQRQLERRHTTEITQVVRVQTRATNIAEADDVFGEAQTPPQTTVAAVTPPPSPPSSAPHP